MQTLHIAPVFVNDEFTELAGIRLNVLQELAVSLKSGAGEHFKQMLHRCGRRDAGDASRLVNLCKLLR